MDSFTHISILSFHYLWHTLNLSEAYLHLTLY